MSVAKSEFAISELAHLDAVAAKSDVVMSFEEAQSVRVASWAVTKFGADVLVQRVVEHYNQAPAEQDGETVNIFESGSQQWQQRLDEASDVGGEVAKDLESAVKRLGRGYPLGSFSVRGAMDTTAVIGSLERAVEVNPENLAEGEQYMQAAARYMLDHMQVTDSKPDQSISYIL